MVNSELRIKIGREGGKTFSLLQQSAVVRKRLLHWDPAVQNTFSMSTYKPGTNPLQCSKDMCTEMTLQVGTVIKVLKQPKLPKNANWTYYFNAEINGAYCRSICCIILRRLK